MIGLSLPTRDLFHCRIVSPRGRWSVETAWTDPVGVVSRPGPAWPESDAIPVDGGRPRVDPRCPSRQRQAPSSRSPLSTGRDSIADCMGFASLEVGSRGPSRPGQVPDLEYSREDMDGACQIKSLGRSASFDHLVPSSTSVGMLETRGRGAAPPSRTV